MTTLLQSRCVSTPVTLHDTRTFLVDRHPAFWGTPYIDPLSRAASSTSLSIESGCEASPSLDIIPSTSRRSSDTSQNATTVTKRELISSIPISKLAHNSRSIPQNSSPKLKNAKSYGELMIPVGEVRTTPSSDCDSFREAEECPLQHLSSGTTSVSEGSIHEEEKEYDELDDSTYLESSYVPEEGLGRKRMNQWLKTLKRKSKMPSLSLELLDDGDNSSRRYSLGTIKSINTGRTQLTSSTCFIGQMRPVTMSGRSASCYLSLSGVSRLMEVDGVATEAPMEALDLATVNRSRQRRKIIEEIISSEEAYLGDLRTLSSVYEHATRSSSDVERKRNVKQNIVDLIEIHESLSTTVLQSFPSSAPSVVCDHAGHTKVIDVSPDIAQLARGDGLAEPYAVKSICSIFEDFQPLFFAYEEYSATYDDMMDGIKVDYKLHSDWKLWESGYEMLANTVQSVNSKAAFHGKKAVTLADLLIKPIHRICRYPLLFKQLLRFTPVIDCPESNLALQHIVALYEDVLSRVDRIKAKESALKEHLQKTWLLRERIQITEKNGPSHKTLSQTHNKQRIREMGKALMCGTLYVAWPTHNSFEGAYYACVLYKTHLVIAGFSGHSALHATYPVQFILPIEKLIIEEADCGKGFCCPSVPYSWKLSFKTEKSAFDIVLCGSTAREGEMWRANLQQRICALRENIDHPKTLRRHLSHYSSKYDRICIVPDDLRPVAKTITHPGSGFRSELSGNSTPSELTHAVGATSHNDKVQILYILNTDLSSDNFYKSTPASPSSPSRPSKHDLFPTNVLGNSSDIYRSRSGSGAASGNRIYTISPARHERAKAENLLCDVWSSELLEPLTTIMTTRTTLPNTGRTSTLSHRSVSRGSMQNETTLMRRLSNHGISLPWPSRKKSYPGLQPIDLEITSVISRPRSPHECSPPPPQMLPRSSSYTFGRTPSKRQALGLRLNTVVSRPPSSWKQEIPDTQENIGFSSSIVLPKRSKSVLRKTSSEKAVPTKAECWWLVNADSSSSSHTSPAHSDFEIEISPISTKSSMPPPPIKIQANGRGNIRRFLTGF